MKSLTRIGTTNIVHARIKDCISSPKALQASSYLVTLLKDGYLITILG